MIPRDKYKSVQINITTYKTDLNHTNMNGRRYSKNKFNSFICELCLNEKSDREIVCNRSHITCPVCQRNDVPNNFTRNVLEKRIKENCNSKEVQTTESNVNENLDLLDEVLKVFKNKKDVSTRKENDKVCKDVETSTDNSKGKAKLTRSKIFLYSIDHDVNEKQKCAVVNSYPSERKKSIELIKHKSSSIPQMKMDELKYALREKTKSKDAIEEVNRMFATVRKFDSRISDDSNRPMVRHGPRVLPVVKTKPKVDCKYCQVNCMSSGDSDACCHRKIEEEKCDKCVYMLCCHYKNNRKQMENDVVLRESCSKKHYCEKCTDCNHWEEGY